MKLKHTLCCAALLLLLQAEVQAQFSSGSGFFIGATTTVSIDGLVLKPTFNTTNLVNKTITLSADAVEGSPTFSINRVYVFNEPLTFSGNLGIVYLPSELNGNTEETLEIAYRGADGHYITTTSSTPDAVQHFVSQSLLGKSMLKVTAVDGKSKLPVTLASFNARKTEHQAELTWITAAEINSSFFDVQRSKDGQQWMSVGKVDASRESKSVKPYLFLDKNPGAGENLYRLKMVDGDGTYAYSKLISLNFDKGIETNVYPNPVSDMLSLKVDDWTKVNSINLYNTAGQPVLLPAHSTSANASVREYNLRSLPSGTYLIKITRTDGLTGTAKIVKQ